MLAGGSKTPAALSPSGEENTVQPGVLDTVHNKGSLEISSEQGTALKSENQKSTARMNLVPCSSALSKSQHHSVSVAPML